MKIKTCKAAAALCAAVLAMGSLSLPAEKPTVSSSPVLTASAADTGSRIRVDINKNDGRKASYSKNAHNWLLTEGASDSFTVNGVTFKLSNGGSVGGNVTGANNKKLQLQSQVYPRLTMDGAKIKDGDNGGVLKLEISGLSDGAHSLQMWHAGTDGVAVSSQSIAVNGKTVMTGVKCPTNITNENDAGMSYVTWTGKSVTITITPEGNGKQNVAWLNGFELDGADPFRGISRMSPADQETHHDRENGLSWTAGQGATEHQVYLGTNYNSVFNATTASPEYMGSQTGTTYALSDTLSSIPTYYWRVDEVSANGTVKGAVYSFQLNRLAFPTAEGYGRYARGGRGGAVYHVTNLNDSGEGSLRYGVETMKGARTIVFDVGGVIALKSALVVPDDGGDLYIAGQTAPGNGITLINYDFGAMGSSDVVIRDMRTRVGDMNGKSTGGMGLGSCNYCIVDHCSISWATDEGFSSRSAANISFQWNIIAESLNESVHYDANDRNKTEPHSFAASISGYTGSFHHNLLVDNTGRNVSLAGAMEQDAVTYGGQLDFRNNVIYNWRDRTTDGGVRRLQFVGNYYKAGAVSNTSLHVVSLDGNELNTSDMQKMYVSGNMMVQSNGSPILKASDDAWAKGKAKSGGKNSTNADVRSDQPFFESYVNTQSAEDAYKNVIASAGANKPGYDYLDSRYIKEVTNGSYTYTGSKGKLNGIIDSQNDVGGYPNSNNFKGGTAPTDTDRDGMPDAWESEHGLNPNDPTDGNKVTLSADDYTNLEMYLNELAGDPVNFNAIPEPDPISGEKITELTIADKENHVDWSIVQGLKTGDLMFGDREVTYAALPAYLEGAEYIRTAADSKAFSGDLATFTAAQDITLYVALDKRVTTVPAWLSAYEKTGQTVTNSNDVAFDLYALDVPLGETITLGSNGQSSGCVNYVVFATEQGMRTLMGDVNADGAVTIADAVMLQKWLLGAGSITDWTQGDFNADGILDSRDLTHLKRVLLP